MKEGFLNPRRVNFKSLIIIGMIIISVGIIALLQNKNTTFIPPGDPQLGKGTPAPNFTLPDLTGKSVSLTDYRGKVVLLNIWATWCPPCVEEMPSLEKLHQAMKGESFEILTVSLDESGAEVVTPFMKKHKLNFPALIDSAGTLKNLYQTTGIPESLIITKDGVILEKIIGPRNWASSGAIKYFRELSRINQNQN